MLDGQTRGRRQLCEQAAVKPQDPLDDPGKKPMSDKRLTTAERGETLLPTITLDPFSARLNDSANEMAGIGVPTLGLSGQQSIYGTPSLRQVRLVMPWSSCLFADGMDVAPNSNRSRDQPGSLFRSKEFRQLWALGGIVNAMRWVEMLAAALFTFEATGSGVTVALVSAARSLPLLCFGAIAGVVCEAVNRKHILFWGMLLSAAAALSICLLAAAGWVRPWHVACAAFASGSVWATEMAVRRRMVGECAGATLMSRAIALDSLTSSFARVAGPLLGSLSYAQLGLVGACAISTACYLFAALLALGIRHSQATRRIVFTRIPGELVESFTFALRQPTVLAVLGVTATMNLFAFSYVALVAPLARTVFGVSDAMVGLLATGEPLGALLGGLLLTSRTPKSSPLALMIAGSALFLVALAAMPLMPGYGLACGVLVGGGLGLALFSNMQTTLVLTGVPAHLRSRQMGLITVCIGLGPLGQVLIGILAQGLGPSQAIIISASAGLVALATTALLCVRTQPTPPLPPG